jgi:hypothetical protein
MMADIAQQIDSIRIADDRIIISNERSIHLFYIFKRPILHIDNGSMTQV